LWLGGQGLGAHGVAQQRVVPGAVAAGRVVVVLLPAVPVTVHLPSPGVQEQGSAGRGGRGRLGGSLAELC